MTIQFTVSALIPATPYAIYHAWLDSKEHTAMTEGGAECSAEVGGAFTAWDGYIMGTNLALTPGARIVQTWRTTEFEESDPDSWLEITFVSEGDGTRLTLKHIDLPAHGMQYYDGWIENYFEPMQAYFGAKKPTPDEQILAALNADQTIDITTIGRKSGQPVRIEIWFHNIDGTIYITGTPGKRSWYANMLANPNFTFHLKESLSRDLPALAVPILNPEERRQILARVTESLYKMESSEEWIANNPEEFEEWVANSPLVEVQFDG